MSETGSTESFLASVFLDILRIRSHILRVKNDLTGNLMWPTIIIIIIFSKNIVASFLFWESSTIILMS